MRHVIRLLTIMFLTLNLFQVKAQTLSEKIDSYIRSYVATNDFSGCVLISKNDSILFSQCYGKANYSFEIPNTMETKFKIGSISKQFTAAAILNLEERYLLSTSDTLSEFFPEKPNAKKITIQQLLTHTSGLADIYDLSDFSYFPCIEITLTEIADMVLNKNLYFEPGEQYQYSNGGYIVLAKIIEKVSNESYENYITNTIFKKLGMKSSGSCNKNELVKKLAVGYDPYGYNDLIKADDMAYLTKGAGSLYTSPQDLLIWINSLRDRALLSENSYQKLFKDYGHKYGYGISVYKSFGKEVFGHDGRLTGYIADYLHYKADNISVIITGNIQTGVADFLRKDIAAIIYDKSYKSRAKNIPLAKEYPSIIDRIPGSYRFGSNFTVYVDKIDGKIKARANQGFYSELVALQDGRFFNRTLYAYIQFIEGKDKVITKMLWTNNDGNIFEGKRK